MISTFRTSLFFIFLFTLACLNGCAGLPFMMPKNYVEPRTGMEFVLIKGGTFAMGDASETWSENEIPVHSVTVDDFYAGKYEVTFAQYDAFCEETGRSKPDDEGWGRGQRPVINVSWDDAVAFADWLGGKSGFTISLPSEAQWEYMARAGVAEPFWSKKSWMEGYANCANCGGQWGGKSTAPVGSFPPNPYGLYDTAGNVAEWCLDPVHTNYENAPANDEPWEGGRETDRIIRGGSWSHSDGDLRSSFRDWARKDDSFDNTGFRLVIPPPLPALK